VIGFAIDKTTQPLRKLAAIRKEHIRKDEETVRFYIFIEGGKIEHRSDKFPSAFSLADQQIK
jgi:hypothetical protein